MPKGFPKDLWVIRKAEREANEPKVVDQRAQDAVEGRK